MILDLLHSNNTQLSICGDININCLAENKIKNPLLYSLLPPYNLTSTVYCPARIQNNSVTAIDDILINVTKFDDYIFSPLVNRLSDHNVQLITINDINLKILNNTPRYIRNIYKHGIADFKIELSLKTWDNIFDNDNVNSSYISFLNTHLRVFYTSFPLKKLITKTNGNAWVTAGIRTACKHKRELYLLCKSSNDLLFKNYYKLYCKILSNVTREAKKRYCSKQIENSKNKMKTIRDITIALTGIKTKNEDMHQLNIYGNVNYNLQTIPDFLTTTFYL
jgi:hypothetical protein